MRVVNFQVKQMLRSLKYHEYGMDRKFFEQQYSSVGHVEGAYFLQIYKGFKTTMDVYKGSKAKLLIDVCCKVVRGWTLYEEMEYY